MKIYDKDDTFIEYVEMITYTDMINNVGSAIFLLKQNKFDLENTWNSNYGELIYIKEDDGTTIVFIGIIANINSMKDMLTISLFGKLHKLTKEALLPSQTNSIVFNGYVNALTTTTKIKASTSKSSYVSPGWSTYGLIGNYAILSDNTIGTSTYNYYLQSISTSNLTLSATHGAVSDTNQKEVPDAVVYSKVITAIGNDSEVDLNFTIGSVGKNISNTFKIVKVSLELEGSLKCSLAGGVLWSVFDIDVYLGDHFLHNIHYNNVWAEKFTLFGSPITFDVVDADNLFYDDGTNWQGGVIKFKFTVEHAGAYAYHWFSIDYVRMDLVYKSKDFDPINTKITWNDADEIICDEFDFAAAGLAAGDKLFIGRDINDLLPTTLSEFEYDINDIDMGMAEKLTGLYKMEYFKKLVNTAGHNFFSKIEENRYFVKIYQQNPLSKYRYDTDYAFTNDQVFGSATGWTNNDGAGCTSRLHDKILWNSYTNEEMIFKDCLVQNDTSLSKASIYYADTNNIAATWTGFSISSSVYSAIQLTKSGVHITTLKLIGSNIQIYSGSAYVNVVTNLKLNTMYYIIFEIISSTQFYLYINNVQYGLYSTASANSTYDRIEYLTATSTNPMTCFFCGHYSGSTLQDAKDLIDSVYNETYSTSLAEYKDPIMNFKDYYTRVLVYWDNDTPEIAWTYPFLNHAFTEEEIAGTKFGWTNNDGTGAKSWLRDGLNFTLGVNGKPFHHKRILQQDNVGTGYAEVDMEEISSDDTPYFSGWLGKDNYGTFTIIDFYDSAGGQVSSIYLPGASINGLTWSDGWTASKVLLSSYTINTFEHFQIQFLGNTVKLWANGTYISEETLTNSTNPVTKVVFKNTLPAVCTTWVVDHCWTTDSIIPQLNRWLNTPSSDKIINNKNIITQGVAKATAEAWAENLSIYQPDIEIEWDEKPPVKPLIGYKYSINGYDVICRSYTETWNVGFTKAKASFGYNPSSPREILGKTLESIIQANKIETSK